MYKWFYRTIFVIHPLYEGLLTWLKFTRMDPFYFSRDDAIIDLFIRDGFKLDIWLLMWLFVEMDKARGKRDFQVIRKKVFRLVSVILPLRSLTFIQLYYIFITPFLSFILLFPFPREGVFKHLVKQIGSRVLSVTFSVLKKKQKKKVQQ